MPNHVTNNVKLFGEHKELVKLIEFVKNDESGVWSFDFNKIIPMPDYIFRGNLDVKTKMLYGKNNWYDWAVTNWGTKWNAYLYSGYLNGCSGTISFFTAWSAPHPVIEKLSKMFPDVKISHAWADEDIGNNCGRREYYGGERTEEYYPESEKDRFEFAADVMGIDLEIDVGLCLNASETGYINIEGDNEYERIELFGKPALFTNERITDANIPKGMFCYHLRHGDDGNFETLEKCVAVNHAGSVITKEPLDLGKEGYISLTDENAPNFTGEIVSLYEFREMK